MSDQDSMYQTLFDRLPIGLFRITPTGEILRVNAVLVRMLGYPDKDDLIGKGIRPFYFRSKDLDETIRAIEATGVVDDAEIQMRRMDGSGLWVRLNARSVASKEDGSRYIEGAIEDISQHRLVSEALQESDHFIKNIIESVGEGVIVYDLGLQTMIWNGYMERLTGISSVEASGQQAFDLFPDLHKSGAIDFIKRALHGETAYQEDVPYRNRVNGDQGFYSAVYSPYRSARGEILGVVAAIHETTARRQAVEEREQLLTREREQRQHAETMGRVSQALNAVLDLPKLLELICRESSELLRVDAALVWLVERNAGEGGVLENIAGYGWEHERFAGMQINIDDMNNFATRVIRERKPVCLNEVTEDIHTGLSGIFKARSILGVPLFHAEEVIGVLQLIDTHKINRFGETEIASAAQLGSHAAIAVNNAQLYDQLAEAHRALEDAYVSTLEGWARALELRDARTEGHSNRVTELTLRLARLVGVEETELEHIRRGALLHDIGKMGVPDRILDKPGELDDEEWVIMRRHPEYARTMLSPIQHLRQSVQIPYYHHERWDGSGYPRGLRGEEIPLPARIFAVVDVFDALTSDRPYRPAWTRENAIHYIKTEAGRLFDPQIVTAFLKLV